MINPNLPPHLRAKSNEKLRVRLAEEERKVPSRYASMTAMLDSQASAILDAVDVILRSGRTIDFAGFDEHGIAVIRSGSAVWRGSSVRDALAQFAEACR